VYELQIYLLLYKKQAIEYLVQKQGIEKEANKIRFDKILNPITNMNMKQSFLIIIALFVSFFSNGQDQKQIDSDIKQVTVFQNKAQIVNTATATVESGITALTIAGLSQFVEQNSIQVTGKGDFVILGVKQKVNYIQQAKKSPEYIALEDTTEKIKLALEHLKDKAHILAKEEDMILANQQVGGKEKSLTADEFEEYLDLFRDRLTEIRTFRSKTQRELLKKEELYNHFKNQLESIRSQQDKPSTEVTITVSAKSRTTIGLELSYLVGNTGWTPIYDLRSKNTTSAMQLIYKANVYQNTGVDWERVKIKLSTGNPSVGGVKPELYTWNLAIQEEIQKKSKGWGRSERSAYDGINTMELKAIQKAEIMEAGSMANEVSVIENSMSIEFDIPVPYSVPSDGNYVLMDVQTFQIPVVYKHYTTPKLDNGVFLTALLTNWEQYNLIPGNANVYFEGTFVGETYLDLLNTEDTLLVSLGRDKKVIVKRETIKDFTSKKLIGSNRKVEYAYEIEARNVKKDTIALVVEDQIPVSSNNEIEVEVVDLGGAELNKETGKLTWRINLASTESKKTIFRFIVKYPKGKNIIGL
jgi:uncharacterized protein (TIGR02231 family)